MKKNILSTLILSSLLCGGCGQTTTVAPSADYMVLDSVVLVNDFPQSSQLRNGKKIDIAVIGAKDFVLVDTLLITSSDNDDGMWSFFSTKDYKHLGKCLQKGNGPNEFLQSPYVRQAKFTKKNGDLHAIIYDFAKGYLYEMNVIKTIKKGALSMSLIKELPKNLFNVVVIDSNRIFCRSVESMFTQQNRYLLNNEKQYTTPNINKLNLSQIKPDGNINILSADIKTNDSGTLVVEQPIGLNYINLYSLDANFGKTIYTEGTVYNISSVGETPPEDRIYTYADLRVYGDFFALLSFNVDEKTFQTDNSSIRPTIQIFDWQGQPLYQIKCDKFITAFEFDLRKNLIYTYNNNTEEFYVYDISEMEGN